MRFFYYRFSLRFFPTLFLVMVIALTGCVSNNKSMSDTPPHEDLRVFIKQECPVTSVQPESALLGALATILPKLIDKTLEGLATAVRKAGEAEVVSLESTKTLLFYDFNKGDINMNVGCLVVVRGRFKEDDLDVREKRLKEAGWEQTDAASLANIGLYDSPDIYFEGPIENAPSGDAFVIKPALFRVNRFLEKSIFSGERDYVLTFSFAKPDTQSPGKAFATSSLSFKKMMEYKGIILSDSLSNSSSTGWMPVPALGDKSKQLIKAYNNTSDAVKTKEFAEESKKFSKQIRDSRQSLKKVGDPYVQQIQSLEFNVEKQKILGNTKQPNPLTTAKLDLLTKKHERDQDKSLKIAKEQLDILLQKQQLRPNKPNPTLEELKSKSYKAELAAGSLEPVSLTVTITETKNANEFLLALADILSESKEGVTTVITEQIIPDERSKADDKLKAKETKDLESTYTLRSNALVAINELKIAEQDLENTSEADLLKNENEVQIKRLKVEEKCQILGVNDLQLDECDALGY